MWQELCERLSQNLENTIQYRNNRSISGGCIHNAQLLETDLQNYFVKSNRLDYLSMFEAEAEGLRAIQACDVIRTPKAVLVTEIGNVAILVLEYIEMKPAQPQSMAKLGEQLADLHRNTGPSFGWSNENYIGLTPQSNTEDQSWVSFFKTSRLSYQMNLARKNGLELHDQDKLLENIGVFFEDYTPSPSLLHGDLWGGNAGFDVEGNPVIFDPACYYGDREADLAFTEMFGGFSADFYNAYKTSYPMHDGYSNRKRLYNLYHELNHYNLFGGGYGNQACGTIHYLLSVL